MEELSDARLSDGFYQIWPVRLNHFDATLASWELEFTACYEGVEQRFHGDRMSTGIFTTQIVPAFYAKKVCVPFFFLVFLTLFRVGCETQGWIWKGTRPFCRVLCQ